jgi:hypothetical protein
VAEDITSRFLNVVSLFNGAVPLIAIQLQAFEVGDLITLVFTKVQDEMQCGLVDEDENAMSAPTKRAYWEKEKGTPKTVALMDRLFELVKETDPEVERNATRFGSGLPSMVALTFSPSSALKRHRFCLKYICYALTKQTQLRKKRLSKRPNTVLGGRDIAFA